jgi:hypothetical protein
MAREPLYLDLRSNPRSLGSNELGLGQDKRELRSPMQGDVSKFQQAMDAPDTEATPKQPAEQLPSGPFALFGHVNLANQPLTPSNAQQMLQRVVQRLLVGDGRDSQRSVRMSLSDEVMPGVEVAVYQEAGVWVAAFECRNAQSFDTLARHASEMAQQFTDALQADTAWRVSPDPLAPEVAHLSPVHANAKWNTAGGGT